MYYAHANNKLLLEISHSLSLLLRCCNSQEHQIYIRITAHKVLNAAPVYVYVSARILMFVYDYMAVVYL